MNEKNEMKSLITEYINEEGHGYMCDVWKKFSGNKLKEVK